MIATASLRSKSLRSKIEHAKNKTRCWVIRHGPRSCTHQPPPPPSSPGPPQITGVRPAPTPIPRTPIPRTPTDHRKKAFLLLAERPSNGWWPSRCTKSCRLPSCAIDVANGQDPPRDKRPKIVPKNAVPDRKMRVASQTSVCHWSSGRSLIDLRRRWAPKVQAATDCLRSGNVCIPRWALLSLLIRKSSKKGPRVGPTVVIYGILMSSGTDY